MTWKLTAIQPEDVGYFWPLTAGLLRPAIGMSGGRLSEESVVEWLCDGRYLLWVAHERDLEIKAAFVTREANYPCKRMLTIDLCGGTDLEGWLEEADRVFRSHSRAVGLDGVELAGRAGWIRALRKLGWQQAAVIVETI